MRTITFHTDGMIRLSEDEAWDVLDKSHTGILTTLRRDGTPASLPVWYVVDERTIVVRTPPRTKKVARGNNLLSAGVVNNVTKFGSRNTVAAVNQPAPDANILQQLGLNVVGTFFVDDKTVSSGPGPFEINIRTPFNSPPSSMTLTNASVRSGQEETSTQRGVVRQLLSFRPGSNAGPKATSSGGSTGGSSFKSVSDRITKSVKKLSDTVNYVTRRLAERANTGPADISSDD